MKREDLDYLADQLTGGDAGSPNGHNLVGAINGILGTYDDAAEWDATPGDEDWTDAHEDLQWLLAELVRVANDDLLGSDDVLEDAEGNVLATLPHPATSKGDTGDLPARPSAGGS